MTDEIVQEDVIELISQEITGTVIAKRIGNEVWLGYGLLNPSDKRFDPEIGHTIAWRRLLSGRYRIQSDPSSRQLRDFVDGTGRSGREGKFHPIRSSLVGPMMKAIERASRSRSTSKLPG